MPGDFLVVTIQRVPLAPSELRLDAAEHRTCTGCAHSKEFPCPKCPRLRNPAIEMQSHWISSVILKYILLVSIFYKWETEAGKLIELGHSHTAIKWQSWDLSPKLSDFKPFVLKLWAKGDHVRATPTLVKFFPTRDIQDLSFPHVLSSLLPGNANSSL